ncbi:hypothetical protein [Paraburkholderia unamae]|uniref:SH3 domain-containing protein n=1 Tax=Paraburkholderia unamae TaxID=219649 RepID=A0ABX5KVB6_9BURK|nr:hypothetical protein [Paraburkholderia unamae]PVX86446.1 hypothetical protein C7402_102282 [Paraburkholderia unamae]
MQYQPYVLQLSIALDQFRSAAQTQEERDAAGLLAEALQAYTDAATYWQADIEFYARNGNRLAYMGGQPVGLTGTGYILDRYNVPIQNSDVWGLQKGAPLNVALVTIWQYAKGKTDEAADAIENVGLPVHGGQASGGAAPSNSAASNVTSAVTKELDPPWSMRVSASFTGGSYTQPNYSAKRLDGSVAGVNVTAYASNGDWARVTPVGGPEQWIPMSQLSNPD